jgi:hypothetical protein
MLFLNDVKDLICVLKTKKKYVRDNRRPKQRLATLSLFFFRENSLFDIVLKLASLFDPVKFFLPNPTSKLHFLPKMTL